MLMMRKIKKLILHHPTPIKNFSSEFPKRRSWSSSGKGRVTATSEATCMNDFHGKPTHTADGNNSESLSIPN